MTYIPSMDLARLHDSIEPDITNAIERVVRRNAFIGGTEVSLFEEAFGKAHGSPNAAAVGSGTEALHLALRALGIGNGDEVIVPALTFPATAEAVAHAGATPVFADVDPNTLLLTSTTADAVISNHTKAIIPVHLYGTPVAFNYLEEWQAMGLTVIEDAAQAHLASWRGAPVGKFSDAACFSFYPGKNLGALGDGGAVISMSNSVVDRVRLLRDHGRSSKHVHEEVGFCSRLDGIQAAVLNSKLMYLEKWTDARRQVAGCYASRLGSIEDVQLVPWSPGSVHHQVVVRVSASLRDQLREILAEAGIQTAIHYPVPVPLQPAFGNRKSTYPAAERACAEVISLPIDPLMSASEVDRVCDALLSATRIMH